MTTLEILLMIAGAVIFIASFVMPETKSELDAVDKQLTKEQIQEMLKEEMKQVHQQVTDVIDETVSYSVEKSERALERMTNEKISAISEYAGTVLTDIHKNHEETMFLYDMLSDKHENLKETASEVSKAVKEANETVSEVREASREAGETAFEPMKTSGIERVSRMQVLGTSDEQDATQKQETAQQQDVTQEMIAEQEPEKKTAKKASGKTAKAGTKAASAQTKAKAAEKRAAQAGEIAISFDAGMQGAGSKEQILALHNQGKSNVAIARELGLGIGEVKLVIDLFKGM